MSKCNHPSFQLERPLINLSVIGETADQVYNRIVPTSNGDCNLVLDVANSPNISEYNVIIIG